MFGHDVVGCIAVKHLRVFVTLGVLTFQGSTKSTCTISHGFTLATFTSNLPFCSHIFN
jgi:hypothetical protein